MIVGSLKITEKSVILWNNKTYERYRKPDNKFMPKLA